MTTDLDIPDEVEPTIGWRCWGYHPTRGLYSPVVGNSDWPARAPMTAKCEVPDHQLAPAFLLSPGLALSPLGPSPTGHEAPYEECNCGIHASKLAEQALATYSDIIIGTVKLWGRVVEGTYGYRGQHAYPDKLWVRIGTHLSSELPVERFAAMLSDQYGVPVGVATSAELGAMADEILPVDPAVRKAYQMHTAGMAAPGPSMFIATPSAPGLPFPTSGPISGRLETRRSSRLLPWVVAANAVCAAANLVYLNWRIW
jgi:hypothetical protein